MIQQHHEFSQMSVPVDRRAPEGIGIGLVPSHVDWKNRGDWAAQAGLAPPALIILLHRTHRRVSAVGRHACQRHALGILRASVVTEKKIEILLVLAKQNREVTIPASEVAVL